jgi:hypothetical protein
LAQNYVLLIGPLEGFIENATMWGVVLTGLPHGSFLRRRPHASSYFDAPELPEGAIYIRREVLVASESAIAKEVYIAAPPELNEERGGRRAARGN